MVKNLKKNNIYLLHKCYALFILFYKNKANGHFILKTGWFESSRRGNR